MKNIMMLAAIILASIVLACNQQQDPPAPPMSGLPDLDIPVGPPPGPHKALNLPTDPYIGDPVATQEGRQLFVEYNCAGCHGTHGGGGMAPSLRDRIWIYGDDDAHIFASIAQGRGSGMPAWGTKLPEEQIWKIVAYIKSLRTKEEPDPPIVPPKPLVRTVRRK